MSNPHISRRSILKYGAASLGMAALPSWSASNTTDVLIIGAGMSGLHAARMLQAAGLKVTVIEASSRIGGRCWTAHDVPGRPEFGANEVGHGYGRVRGNAAELGVELVAARAVPAAASKLPPAISIGGLAAINEPWASSAMNHLSAEEKSLSPLQLYGNYISKDMPLADLGDWLKPQFAPLDKMSLRQYFISKGASAEALRLMNVNVSSRNLDDANALEFLRKANFGLWESKAGPYSLFKDGMNSLTDAMAKSLTQPVTLNKIVSRIDAGKKQVRVSCKDGASYTARHCILTAPLSVMKNIRIDGAVPPRQREAWSHIKYIQLIQVFMKINAPYWERDGMSGGLWTDGPIERVLHAPSATDANGYLAAYINGEGVDAPNKMSTSALSDFMMAEIKRMRPAMAESISVTHIHNWTTQPYTRGHIAYFTPGDVGRYADVLAHPVGALHFAGEHCGKIHAGIEAACESGENAALQILDALDTA